MMQTELEYKLPCNILAEEMVIGGVLVDSQALENIVDRLHAEDFYKAVHRKIFTAMLKLFNDGQGIDVFTVKETAGLQDLQHLVELASAVPGTANIKFYADSIKTEAIKRRAIVAANSIISFILNSGEANAEEIVHYTENALSEITSIDSNKIKVLPIKNILRQTIEDVDRRFKTPDVLEGLSTGLPSLDELTTGFKPGELIILAARPSMGKSTIAMQISSHFAEREKARGLFFSLEMPSLSIGKKIIATTGHLKLDFMKNPRNYGDDIWPRLEGAVGRIINTGLHVIDCPGIHINEILATSRREARKEKIHFIFVDHIHLVESIGKSRERELAIISSSLKKLAGELNCCVVALAQLNREIEKRDNKRPKPSDLRDSGSIEQDADVILFVYRDDYYNDSAENPNRGLVEIIQGKNRNGIIGFRCFENIFAESRIAETDRYAITEPPIKYFKKTKKQFDD